MVAVIASILKDKISALKFIDRLAGLAVQGVRPEFKKDAPGLSMIKIPADGVYPIACDADAECWENGQYKHLLPDASKGSVAFFTDNGGTQLASVEGPKQSRLKFSFDIRFLCWLNLPKLAQTECNFSGLIVPEVLAQFHGQHETGTDRIQALEVTGLKQLIKLPSMFSPFTFAQEGANKGLFLYPYDYFGINIKGTFIIPKNCLDPLFPEDFEFEDAACKTQ
jgi:hypothetical protein